MKTLILVCFLGGLGLPNAASEQSQGPNLALYGKATQSNLIDNPYSGYANANNANNAIDGNHDSHFYHGSCTGTVRDTNPWWRVDLLKESIITSVVITNRGDCCSEELNGAEIHIGSSLLDKGKPQSTNFRPWWRVDLLKQHQVFSVTITNYVDAPQRIKGAEILIGTCVQDNKRCAVISSIPAGGTQTFDCNGMIGRHVTVVIPGRAEYLSLCEVEVSGFPLE